MLESIAESPAASAVGWSLVEFAWQGTVVAVVAGAVLIALTGADARIRYAIACAAMLVMVLLPVRTALRTYASSVTHTATARARIAGTGFAVSPPAEAARTAASSTLERPEGVAGAETPASRWPAIDIEPWLPMIVLAWALGVVVLSIRMAGGWALVRRLRRQGRPANAALRALVDRVAARVRLGRPVAAMVSTLVQVPTVIGWLRPVVLVPASALSGLTPEQLQAVVAHELAHIRRHDYLVNILQTVAETLLYYHPAVWWLSGRIRAEREHAADDIAVAACGDPLLYARALESLERVRPATAMAVGATGGSLVGRVRRILGRSLQAEPAFGARSAWLALPASLAALAVIVFSGSGSPAVATPAPPLPPMPEFELLFNPQGNLPAAPGPAIAVAPELAAPQQIAVQDHVEALPGAAIAVAPARPGAVQLPNFTAQVPSTPATPVQWTALEPGFAWTPAQTPAPFPTVIHRGDGWIGVELGDGPDRGAVVNRVVPDSPASDAGIEPGDLITEYNQTPVVGARQLSRLASETPIGRTVPLAIVRGGQEQTVQVTVAEPSNPFRLVSQRDNYTSIVPGGADGDVRQIFGYNTGPFSVFGGGGVALGVQVDTMTPELRQFFGADPGEGVLIVGMEEDSIGERAGLRVGDVIVAVDGNVVDSANDVRNLTRAVLATGNSVTVTVMRDRNQSEVVVEAEDQE